MIIWLKWTLIVVGILVAGILIIKIATRNNTPSNLDSRINGVRSRWDKVCAKISRMVGC